MKRGRSNVKRTGETKMRLILKCRKRMESSRLWKEKDKKSVKLSHLRPPLNKRQRQQKFNKPKDKHRQLRNKSSLQRVAKPFSHLLKTYSNIPRELM